MMVKQGIRNSNWEDTANHIANLPKRCVILRQGMGNVSFAPRKRKDDDSTNVLSRSPRPRAKHATMPPYPRGTDRDSCVVKTCHRLLNVDINSSPSPQDKRVTGDSVDSPFPGLR